MTGFRDSYQVLQRQKERKNRRLYYERNGRLDDMPTHERPFERAAGRCGQDSPDDADLHPKDY